MAQNADDARTEAERLLYGKWQRLRTRGLQCSDVVREYYHETLSHDRYRTVGRH
jgi:hypothetical protein